MFNRKIAISAVSILTAFTMLGASAFAAFSATNTNTGNSFGVGSLALTINGQTPTSTGVFNVAAAVPGATSSALLALHNSGTLPETSVVLTGLTLGNDVALANDLTLQFFNDANGNGLMDGGEALVGTAHHLNDPLLTGLTLPGVTIPAGGTYNLGAMITFDSGAPNSDQGLHLTFDMAFQANQ